MYLNKSQAFSPLSHNNGTASGSGGQHSSLTEETADVTAEKDEVKFFSPCIELHDGWVSGVLSGGNEKKAQKLLQHTDEKRAAANQIHVWLDENALKKQKL